MEVKLEIAVFSAMDAISAYKGGADRIELCASIQEGGITPSYGTIVYTREKLNIPIFVMIRPRGGDFVYSETEVEVMKSDIRFCKEIGIDGVVFGALNPDGTVNLEICMELVHIAKPMEITFHRAFDRASDPFIALSEIINCGFDRILTSGQKPTAPEGRDLIKKLMEKSAGRIGILPGSGIEAGNLESLHNYVQAAEYHSSAKEIKQNKGRENEVSMSSVSPDSAKEWVVSEDKVADLKKICGRLNY